MGRAQSRESKLYVRIAEEIRARVENGEFGPGDKLPTLAQLAEQYSCSRATVREALSALRGQGLVEFRHGDGTYVRTAAIDMWMEPLDAALLLSLSQVRQMIQLLTSVLAGLAWYVAGNVREEGLSRLNSAVFRLECADPQGEEAVAAEIEFFLALSELANNPLIENVVRVMQESFRSVVRFANRSAPTGLPTCTAVFEAVRDGDGTRARDLLFTYGDALHQAMGALGKTGD